MLDAIAVKVELPRLNRVIGDRETTCCQFVWIEDFEYRLRRNHLFVPCTEFEVAFKEWATRNEFTSQWK